MTSLAEACQPTEMHPSTRNRISFLSLPFDSWRNSILVSCSPYLQYQQPAVGFFTVLSENSIRPGFARWFRFALCPCHDSPAESLSGSRPHSPSLRRCARVVGLFPQSTVADSRMRRHGSPRLTKCRPSRSPQMTHGSPSMRGMACGTSSASTFSRSPAGR